MFKHMMLSILLFAIVGEHVVDGFSCLMQSTSFRRFTSRHHLGNNPYLEEDFSRPPEPSHLFANEVSSFGISTALAEQQILLGNYQEAERLAQEAMEIGSHPGEKNNVYAAYAKGIMADALFHEQDYQGAAEMYKEALKSYEHYFKEKNGPEAVELVGSLNLVAWTLLSQNKYEEAKNACAAALALTGQLHGPDSISTAAMMVNLATAYINTGDLDAHPEALIKRAIDIFEQVKRSTDKRSSSDDEDINYKIGISYLTLGNIYYLRGNDNAAEIPYKRVEQMFNLGEFDVPEAASGLKNLGMIHWRRGEVHSAERLLGQALFVLEMSDKFGPNHTQTERVRDLLKSLRIGMQAPPSVLLYAPIKSQKATSTTSIPSAQGSCIPDENLHIGHKHDITMTTTTAAANTADEPEEVFE